MVEVLIIAGSRSDSSIVDKTAAVLREIGIEYETQYASAHREPEQVRRLVDRSGAKVFIAIAGLSAALPGVVASMTDKPVIGVPVNAAMGGLDALLSIVQMPKGVPVASVGVDNGQNAAYLAARILGVDETRKKAIPRTYAEAGVDEKKVNSGLLVLGEYVKRSHEGVEVSHEYGHYANMVKVTDDLFIALSTDGVGSKVLVAELAGRYDTIGIDCVAMNVNDLICVGSMPVGFVDYLASEHPLPDNVLKQIGEGLLEGCRQSRIPILGGETAILPEMIRGTSGVGLDLAGTAVGVARRDDIIDGSRIADGDAIIGVASNGIHSNGFTLARKVLLSKIKQDENLTWGVTLADELLRPTRIYVPHFRDLRTAGIDIKGLAHITGSAFRKILRLGTHCYSLDDLPDVPAIFQLIQDLGEIDWSEMFATFNMGVGLAVVVAEDQAKETMSILRNHSDARRIGTIHQSENGSVEILQHEVTIT